MKAKRVIAVLVAAGLVCASPRTASAFLDGEPTVISGGKIGGSRSSRDPVDSRELFVALGAAAGAGAFVLGVVNTVFLATGEGPQGRGLRGLGLGLSVVALGAGIYGLGADCEECSGRGLSLTSVILGASTLIFGVVTLDLGALAPKGATEKVAGAAPTLIPTSDGGAAPGVAIVARF